MRNTSWSIARTKAKKIIADLKGGWTCRHGQAVRKDPGAAQQGGDLGFFKKDEMVPEFATAAFARRKPGQVSDQPVHTQFELARHHGGGAASCRGAELRPGEGGVAPEAHPGRRPEGGRRAAPRSRWRNSTWMARKSARQILPNRHRRAQETINQSSRGNVHDHQRLAACRSVARAVADCRRPPRRRRRRYPLSGTHRPR